MKKTSLLLAIAFLLHVSARAEDAVRPGEFRVEPPTLLNLGFDWDISGDDNRNTAVEMRYRQSGTEPWKNALPLLRMGGERVFRVVRSQELSIAECVREHVEWRQALTPVRRPEDSAFEFLSKGLDGEQLAALHFPPASIKLAAPRRGQAIARHPLAGASTCITRVGLVRHERNSD